MNFEEVFAKLKDNSVLDIQGRKEIVKFLWNKVEEDIKILQRHKWVLYAKLSKLDDLEYIINDMGADENTLKTRYINISEDIHDLADIVSNLEGVL
jgi:hypothetical protein